MQSLAHPFQRLQWKLTFSYTWITLATLVLLALAGSIAGMEMVAANFSHLAVDDLKAHASDLVPYMSATPPDQAGITRWLQQTQNLTTQVVVSDVPHIAYSFMLDGFTAVVDQAGVVVASHGAGAASVGTLLEPQLPQPAVPVLRAALEGQTDASRLVVALADGTALVAYPLVGAFGRIEGALVAEATGLSQPVLLFNTLLFALVLSLPVAVFAAFIGTIFGFFTARGFSRRFKHLSFTVEEWGQGNFRVMAKDASGDELGQLTRRLNHLAAQFQMLLHEHQQLAILEERNRLARDLHDSVKQQVFAISMLINSAKGLLRHDLDHAQTCLEETDTFVQHVQQELTTLVQALRPSALEKQGLVKAMREFASQWSQQSGIATEITVAGELVPSMKVEETLFRIVQEALANVARHSRATRVEITMTSEQETCRLKVDDNGQGFDYATKQGKGIGLLSMQERMHSVDGTLLIESAPGQGTHITARCPMPGLRVGE